MVSRTDLEVCQGIYGSLGRSNQSLKKIAAAIISTISILAAASFVVLHHSERGLELEGNGIGEMDTSGMQVSMLACNPSPVPVSVDGIDAVLGGSTGQYGALELAGAAIGPHSAKPLSGKIDFADIDSMKSFVGWAVGSMPNPDFGATVKVRERLLGVIPYQYEKNYTMGEFSGMLFGNVTWSCGEKGNYEGTRQQLGLAWDRMSLAGMLYSEKMSAANSTNSAQNGTQP